MVDGLRVFGWVLMRSLGGVLVFFLFWWDWFGFVFDSLSLVGTSGVCVLVELGVTVAVSVCRMLFILPRVLYDIRLVWWGFNALW